MRSDFAQLGMVRQRPATRSAFTLTELLIVIGIIALVLAVTIPGFGAMIRDSKFNEAEQLISSTLSRARYQAIADNAVVAVRFFPAEWDGATAEEKGTIGGRQHMAMYRWEASTYDSSAPSGDIVFRERFQRITDVNAVVLPNGMWAAPLEAVRGDAGDSSGLWTYYLSGWPRAESNPSDAAFQYDPEKNVFFSADDFLVLFAPDGGVILHPAPYAPYNMMAYDPFSDREVHVNPSDGSESLRRYGATGVVLYQRDPFIAVSRQASTAEDKLDARRGFLDDRGRPFYVHPRSAVLMPFNEQQ